MNIKRRVLLAGAALLGVAAVAATQDVVKVEWKPQVGKVASYQFDVLSNMDMGGGQMMDVKFGMRQTYKTLAVDPEKVTVETVSDRLSLMVGDQDMSQMMGAESFKSVSVMTRSGEVLSTKVEGAGGDFSQPRLENAFTFIFPNREIKIGETWKRMFKGDSAKGTVDGEGVYKLEAVETMNDAKALKISYSYKELVGTAPMTVTGTIWLTAEDGELIKAEYKLVNVEFAPGMPPAAATAKVRRL